MSEDLEATEYVFFTACTLLAFFNCLEDGFPIALFCGLIGAVISYCYYGAIRLVLESLMTEEKGRAVARKALEVIGLAVVMAVLIPKIVGE